MSKTKKYIVHVTDRILEYNEKDEVWDWQEGTGEQDHIAGKYATLKEAFDDMDNWGSRWAMYPSAYIETEEDGEVWESTAEVSKCSKCGHEEWNTMVSSMGTPYKEFEARVEAGLQLLMQSASFS